MIAFEVSRASSHPMIPAYPEINMSEKVYDCRNFFSFWLRDTQCNIRSYFFFKNLKFFRLTD